MKDVHTEHCCIAHGCKYNDPDCSVTTGKLKQSYPCETCNFVFEDYRNAELARSHMEKHGLWPIEIEISSDVIKAPEKNAFEDWTAEMGPLEDKNTPEMNARIHDALDGVWYE